MSGASFVFELKANEAPCLQFLKRVYLSLLMHLSFTRKGKVTAAGKPLREVSIPEQPQDGIVSSRRRHFPVSRWPLGKDLFGVNQSLCYSLGGWDCSDNAVCLP